MERDAKFKIGEIVKHKFLSFRGVIFDVDPTFNNTDEWWLSIPEEIRPKKDQPFYHLLAENDVTEYVAYVSEQNLLYDINKENKKIFINFKNLIFPTFIFFFNRIFIFIRIIS